MHEDSMEHGAWCMVDRRVIQPTALRRATPEPGRINLTRTRSDRDTRALCRAGYRAALLTVRRSRLRRPARAGPPGGGLRVHQEAKKNRTAKRTKRANPDLDPPLALLLAADATRDILSTGHTVIHDARIRISTQPWRLGAGTAESVALHEGCCSKIDGARVSDLGDRGTGVTPAFARRSRHLRA